MRVKRLLCWKFLSQDATRVSFIFNAARAVFAFLFSRRRLSRCWRSFAKELFHWERRCKQNPVLFLKTLWDQEGAWRLLRGNLSSSLLAVRSLDRLPNLINHRVNFHDSARRLLTLWSKRIISKTKIVLEVLRRARRLLGKQPLPLTKRRIN
jgi:hypothetical protein